MSDANSFDEAKLEWFLYLIVRTKDFHSCICGKSIKQLCYLKNNMNNNTAIIGNNCTMQYMKINSGTFFNELTRIRRNDPHKPNAMLIEMSQPLIYSEDEVIFLGIINRERGIKGKPWLQKVHKRIKKTFVLRHLPQDDNNFQPSKRTKLDEADQLLKKKARHVD